ncbi:hypothetical protein Tco_0895118 [Tanacetum coccineum]|uniref:Uncharacterized protein n=1 Tax=Tanacetum coccineum TaxID=301880 RepID=A0ABQ5CDQ7_9ASTR
MEPGTSGYTGSSTYTVHDALLHRVSHISSDGGVACPCLATSLIRVHTQSMPEAKKIKNDGSLYVLWKSQLEAEQQSAGLKNDIQTLERQPILNSHQAASMNELTKLSDQISVDDAFKGEEYEIGEVGVVLVGGGEGGDEGRP